MPELPQDLFGQIDPPQRLLMGPGPVNAHPRVLRAMSADMLGQFDPEMTGYMNQVMALYARCSGRKTTGPCWSTAPRARGSRRRWSA
jgi:(S)-ureidoglycine-glyoxylate aminotransferase